MSLSPRPRIRRVLVDIDATLYDSDPLFVKYFARLYGIELGQRVQEWDFWRDLITPEQFTTLIQDHYHSPAEILGARPYPGAVEAVNAWRASGLGIHVVSDRRPRTVEPTRAWLARIGLTYDRLVLRSPIDKVDYALRHRIDLLVDDKPATIERALAAGLAVATLVYPYNRALLADHPEVVSASTWPTLRRRIESRLLDGAILRPADEPAPARVVLSPA